MLETELTLDLVVADEILCPGCDGGMGGWVKVDDAALCHACGEMTCQEHWRPIRHGCQETKDIRDLNQENP